MRGATQYQRLAAALANTAPTCTGDPRYILDRVEVSDTDRAEMESACATCPLFGLCDAYARAGRPEAGMWAGKYYPGKGGA
ncbi:hypothetical protein GCM10022200_05540 [Microbacterium awajiense]|uniref:4Fe-4S Wbl-type domain-containing protein n=1 Tax=Microbacterium awajiense TaxID=415214 RepID=A0ABP7A700_9MICO